MVFGWVGLTFLLVGGVDFALTWFPMELGNREWAFGTVSQSFNGLPILVLGLGLLTAGALECERWWWAWLAMVACGGLVIRIGFGLAIWAGNVSLALETVPPELGLGLRKAVGKTATQATIYPVICVYLARRNWLTVRTGAE